MSALEIVLHCTGGGNIAFGDLSGVDLTTGNGNICIQARGHAGEDGFIRIADNSVQVAGTNSKVFFGGIFGANVGANGAPVLINGSGQLGTMLSSARFKQDIDPMARAVKRSFRLDQ